MRADGLLQSAREARASPPSRRDSDRRKIRRRTQGLASQVGSRETIITGRDTTARPRRRLHKLVDRPPRPPTQTVTPASISGQVPFDRRGKASDACSLNGSSMSELRHLFPSWGFLLQILAILHFLRRRPESYWFFIILFGGFLAPACTSLRKCFPTSGSFATPCKDSAAGRASKESKPISSIILRPRITRSSANCTKIKASTQRAAKPSPMRLRRAAIPFTRFIRERYAPWQ